MKRQRGFATILLYLAAGAAVLGALYAIYSAIDSSWASTAGVDKGKAEIRAEFSVRDAAALAEAHAEKDRAIRDKEAAERKSLEAVTAASTNYQKGLTDGKKTVDAAVARARAGFRLRDPGRTAGPAECPADRGAPAGAAPAGRDGAAGTELPGTASVVLSAEASEFLIRLAGEADDVVRQLNACQGVIMADRGIDLLPSGPISHGRP